VRSVYSDEQILEQESRIYFSNVCNQLKWKYRTNEQDNDIDGEIEVFEKKIINNKEYNETKARFVKIQLKASAELDSDEETISYPCSIKLLHFADVCDQPIVLVLYDAKKKVAYWLWLQQHIFNYLDINNKSWRDNSSKVIIKVPTKNSVTESSFKISIIQIATTGINEILQFRKTNKLDYYYTEIGHEDVSTSLYRRIVIRVLLEKSFSKSKDAMKILIQELNNKYEISDYYRNEKVKLIHSKNVDILWMFFYDDPRQVKNGLPCCSTEWFKKGIKIDVIPMNADEIINGIKIQWRKECNSLEEIYVKNKMQKGEYIKLLDETFKKVKIIGENLKKCIDDFNDDPISNELLIISFQNYLKEIQEIEHDFTFDRGYSPYECDDIDKCMIELLIILGNIKIFACDPKMDEINKIRSIRQNFNQYIEKLSEYAYERKKIR